MAQTRRICFVMQDLAWAGTQKRLRAMCPPLMKQGYDVTVLSTGGDGSAGEEFRSIGVNVALCEAPAGRLLGRGFWAIRRALREIKPDVVHIIWVRRSLREALAARLAGAGIVTKSHHMRVEKTSRKARLVARLAWMMTDWTVAVSQTTLDDLARMSGLPDRRMSVVYQGSDLSEFDNLPHAAATRRELGISARAPLVGCVSHLWGGKRQDIFLRAAGMILRARPDARFLVVGEGPDRAKLERLAAELGLGASVIFTGLRKDVPALMRAMDATVLASDTEALAGVVVESMLAGTPVIATRCGAQEIIRHGETGLLTPLNDADAIAREAVRLIDYPALRERLASAARAFARRTFSAEAMAAAYGEMFDALLNGREPLARNRAIRVMHLFSALPQASGVATVIRQISDRLAGNDFRFSLCLTDPNPEPPQQTIESAELIALRRKSISRPWCADWGFILALARELRRRRADVVHSHGIGMNRFGAVAARLAGARSLCTSHLMPSYAGRGLSSWIWPSLTDTFTVVGEEIAGPVAHRLRLAPDRIRVIPNGVDVSDFALPPQAGMRKRAELGIAPDALLVGAVGRLTEQKNPVAIIRTAEIVLSRRPDARFILVGSGDLRAELEERIGKAGLTGKVLLLGARTDVPELLAAMDLMLHMALLEGLCLALLEGMAAGKPIIAGRAPGVREVIEDGVSGILVDPQRPDEAAEALLRVAGDATLRAALAEGARKRAEKYSVESMARSYAEVYRSLAQ